MTLQQVCQVLAILAVAGILAKVLWTATEHIDDVNEPPKGGKHG